MYSSLICSDLILVLHLLEPLFFRHSCFESLLLRASSLSFIHSWFETLFAPNRWLAMALIRMSITDSYSPNLVLAIIIDTSITHTSIYRWTTPWPTNQLDWRKVLPASTEQVGTEQLTESQEGEDRAGVCRQCGRWRSEQERAEAPYPGLNYSCTLICPLHRILKLPVLLAFENRLRAQCKNQQNGTGSSHAVK